jgi:hypothetical protein
MDCRPCPCHEDGRASDRSSQYGKQFASAAPDADSDCPNTPRPPSWLAPPDIRWSGALVEWHRMGTLVRRRSANRNIFPGPSQHLTVPVGFALPTADTDGPHWGTMFAGGPQYSPTDVSNPGLERGRASQGRPKSAHRGNLDGSGHSSLAQFDRSRSLPAPECPSPLSASRCPAPNVGRANRLTCKL